MQMMSKDQKQGFQFPISKWVFRGMPRLRRPVRPMAKYYESHTKHTELC